MTDMTNQPADDGVDALQRERETLRSARAEQESVVEQNRTREPDLVELRERLIFQATVQGDALAAARLDQVNAELRNCRTLLDDRAIAIQRIDARLRDIDAAVAEATRQRLADANAADEQRLQELVPTLVRHVDDLTATIAEAVALRKAEYARSAAMGTPNRRLPVATTLGTWLSARLSRVLPSHFDRPRVKLFDQPLDVVLGFAADPPKGEASDELDTEVDGGRGREAGGEPHRDSDDDRTASRPNHGGH